MQQGPKVALRVPFYRRSMYVLFAKYNKNNQVKEDEVGGACGPNGGKEKCV
jgi:hypothetical protein